MGKNNSYTIYDNETDWPYRVYCQFNPDRTGFTFISNNSVQSMIPDLAALTETSTGLNYIIHLQYNDTKQYDMNIRRLNALYDPYEFSISMTPPGVGVDLKYPSTGPCLILKVPKIPGSNQQGFLSNSFPMTFDNCDDSIYFVFYSNLTNEEFVDEIRVESLDEIDSVTALWLESKQLSGLKLNANNLWYGIEIIGCRDNTTVLYDTANVTAAAIGIPFNMTNECADVQCPPGMFCRDLVKNYTCVCYAGYMLTPNGCVKDSLSYSKPAIQSSTSDNNHALQATDGNFSTYSSTDWEMTPWLEIDIGGKYQISGVKLTPRNDSECIANPQCKNRLRDFNIFISHDTGSSKEFALCKYVTGTIDPNAPQTISCDKPLYGRFIRIQRRPATTTTVLEISEIEVFSLQESLSLEKPAYQISTDNDQTASLAVDGKVETCSMTLKQNDPWMLIDLQTASSQIGYIYITFPTTPECVANSSLCDLEISSLEVRVGSNPLTFTGNVLCALEPGPFKAGSTHIISCAKLYAYRYVSIEVPNQKVAMSFCEVKVTKNLAIEKYKSAFARTSLPNSYISGSLMTSGNVTVKSLTQCLANCAARCPDCLSVNYVDVNLSGDKVCEMHSSNDATSLITKTGWIYYDVDIATCL